MEKVLSQTLTLLREKSLKKGVKSFHRLSVEQKKYIIFKLPRSRQQELLSQLKNDEILDLMRYMDPDEDTDIIQELTKKRQKKIIKLLNKDLKEQVEFLSQFDPESAAGIMNLDFIIVDKNLTFKDVARRVQKHEKRTGKFPTILVHNNEHAGEYLPGQAIVLARPNERVSKYTKTIKTIRHDQPRNKILEIFERYPHNKIAVINEYGNIIGIIYADEILKLIHERQAQELYTFAGVKKKERVTDSILTKIKCRYKWLILNLGTAFLAASVISLFEGTIGKFTLLAVYMPIVASMGGNAGTQALAVMVRGIALKEIRLRTAGRPIFNEVVAGIINGIINGVLVTLVATLWNKNPLLGLIVGVAMISNLLIAGFFGALVPLVLNRLGKDAASSASIFITTATDVCGFFIFLSLAELLL